MKTTLTDVTKTLKKYTTKDLKKVLMCLAFLSESTGRGKPGPKKDFEEIASRFLSNASGRRGGRPKTAGKRGPGRPRKTPERKREPKPIRFAHVSPEELNSDKPLITAPKRPRGRPRKHPQVVLSSVDELKKLIAASPALQGIDINIPPTEPTNRDVEQPTQPDNGVTA